MSKSEASLSHGGLKRPREETEDAISKKRQRQLDTVKSTRNKPNPSTAVNESHSTQLFDKQKRKAERKAAKRALRALEKERAKQENETKNSEHKIESTTAATSGPSNITTSKRRKTESKPSWSLSDPQGGRLGNEDPKFVSKDGAEFLVFKRGDSTGALSVADNTLVEGVTLEEEPLLHVFTQKAIDARVLDGGEFVVMLRSRTIKLGRRNASGDYAWAKWTLREEALCFDVRLLDTNTKAKNLDVAVGFADGKIHIYPNVLALLSSSKSLPDPRILHWHRDIVNAVKYTPDGYLVSGGRETTMVIWQLETGDRTYLPNLTATIERIVVNSLGNRYAVQLGDNSIMGLSSTELKPVAYLSGLQLADGLKATALLHPTHKNELLMTVPATRPVDIGDPVTRPFLQTFVADSYSTRQALTRNSVTDFNVSPDKVPIISPDVALLATSSDGQWLASVDEWLPTAEDMDEDERREVYLKFWQWNADTSQWMLNSRIDAPHDKGSVFGLVCLPSKLGFVTIGQDSKVKIWTARQKAAGVQWTCRTTAELDADMESESDPVDATLTVSDDGSLIAAALISRETTKETVQFINVKTGTIRTGNNNIAAPGLIEIAFADRYLIALSAKTLRMWNIVEDVLHYSVGIPAEDGRIPLLAVNKLDNVAVVASPESGSVLTTCQLNPPAVLHRKSTKREVVSVLARPRERGFFVIYNDATTSTYTSTLPSITSQADQADTVSAEIDVVNGTMPTNGLLASGPIVRRNDDTEAPFLEDDRRVVRPEDMARIFDDAATLPSIKEMFHAVAGLYGRRPKHVAAAA